MTLSVGQDIVVFENGIIQRWGVIRGMEGDWWQILCTSFPATSQDFIGSKAEEMSREQSGVETNEEWKGYQQVLKWWRVPQFRVDEDGVLLRVLYLLKAVHWRLPSVSMLRTVSIIASEISSVQCIITSGSKRGNHSPIPFLQWFSSRCIRTSEETQLIYSLASGNNRLHKTRSRVLNIMTLF